MKIAILFYGRIKYWQQLYNSFLKAFDKNELDIFISHSPDLNEHDFDIFLKEYNVISYNNDPIIYYDDFGRYPGKRGETIIHNMTCHYINKKRVFQLFQEHKKKTGTVYDYVIYTRVDIEYNSIIPFETFVDIHDRNKILYIPEGNDWVGGINDQIAIFYDNSNALEIYGNIYDNVINVLESGTIPHPENILRKHLSMFDIIIKRFELNYKIIKP